MTTLILAVTAIVLASLERVPRIRFVRAPLFRSLFASDVFYLLTGFVAGASLALTYVVTLSEWLGVVGIPRVSAVALPLWLSTPGCLVLIDLGNYVTHALLHRFDALWELHKVHHSSRTLDWLATFRSHIFEQGLRRLIAPLALILIGAPIPAVVAAASFFNAWAMLNHSNLAVDLRWLEPVFITPRLHRLHHLPETTHRNLGTLLTLWDRLGGRLVQRDLSPSAPLGVPGEVESYPQGWGRQFIEPMRRLFDAAGVTRGRAAQQAAEAAGRGLRIPADNLPNNCDRDPLLQ